MPNDKIEISLDELNEFIRAAAQRVPDQASTDQDRFNAEVVEALKRIRTVLSELKG